MAAVAPPPGAPAGAPDAAPCAKAAPPAAGDSMLLSMDDFKHFRQIGKGKDCVVYSATCDKLSGASVVLKVYDKAKISAIKHRSVRREARIMRYLTEKGVPHTTSYTGAFQDSKQIYIVMEHCTGGDLLEQLLREGRAMAERRVVREVVLPTLTALSYLHAAGIIHRDIKLENLFISSTGHLQLGDFGLAICTLEERAISPVGTLEYMPPEILRLPSTDSVVRGSVKVEDIEPVDEKVDVWSFGVTVYELVTGRSPFEGASKDEIKAAILGYKMRQLPAFLTPGCQDFILKCMCPAPCDRPSALALLGHPWVQLHCTPADLVAIARLPLQLPRVPMGYHRAQQQQQQQQQQQEAAAAAHAQQQQQQQQQQPVQADSSDSAATCGAPAAAASGGVCAASAPAAEAPADGKGKMPESSSLPGSPSSPQIAAFMPGGSTGSAGGVGSSGHSHDHSRGHSSGHGASVGGGLTSSSGGGASAAGSPSASLADSAASLHPPAERAAASNGGRAKPVPEQAAEEAAAVAAMMQQQQQQQQLHTVAEHAQGAGGKKHPNNGHKLFKWMCMASEPSCSNASL